MKTQLIASSGSVAGILKLAREYFVSPDLQIIQLRDGLQPGYVSGDTVRTIQGFRVVLVRGRYRLESIAIGGNQ